MSPRQDGDAAGRVLRPDEIAAWQSQPLIVFIGVSTGGSLVHTLFDRWAALLGRPWALRGVDLPPGTEPAGYRRLVSAMQHNPAVHGAVITSHKLRMYRACAPDLVRRDWLADLTHEVNALATGASLAGYARDALSLARIIPGLTGRSTAGALGGLNVVCLGAGGAATALLLAMYLDVTTDPSDPAAAVVPRADRPARVVFADTSARALDDLRSVAARAHIDLARSSFVHVRGPLDCDSLVARLQSPALVINATGMGKDIPGSPVTDRARLPPASLAWDLNYRGTLAFLHQAAAHGARTVDGWDYFTAGWAGALAAIADIPFTSGLLTQFAREAAPFRPRPGPGSGSPSIRMAR
jgi:shikimate 5-dehydrogenase